MRMLVLSGSYRAPLMFNDETLDAAEKNLARLRSGFRRGPGVRERTVAGGRLRVHRRRPSRRAAAFTDAMDDDFNTALALAALFDLVKSINTARDQGANDDQLKPAQAVLRELTGVLGLQLAGEAGLHAS